MKKTDTISLVVASDNFYAVLIAALLKSIEVNHKTPEHIDFHIIDDGISSESKKKLCSVVDSEMISVIWHKSKDIIPESLSIPVDTSSFPLTTYLRIFAPHAVGDDVKRIIYLDVDTILEDDISKLWYQDIGDNTIGSVQDIVLTVDCEWSGIPNYKQLGFDPKTKYFNAGVLLVDTVKWRSQNISEKIISTLIEQRDHVRLADQYGLNVVFVNKWYQLDPKWNWYASKDNDNASLVHFLDIKPIFDSYRSNPVFKDRFFKYLSMTPWKDYKVISGKNRLIRKGYNKLKKNLIRLLPF